MTATIGAGQVERPLGIAVDHSIGDLYVADRNNFRIDKFDSEGN
jgi:DNA-binding beta-propeller fold protein YncE